MLTGRSAYFWVALLRDGSGVEQLFPDGQERSIESIRGAQPADKEPLQIHLVPLRQGHPYIILETRGDEDWHKLITVDQPNDRPDKEVIVDHLWIGPAKGARSRRRAHFYVQPDGAVLITSCPQPCGYEPELAGRRYKLDRASA